MSSSHRHTSFPFANTTRLNSIFIALLSLTTISLRRARTHPGRSRVASNCFVFSAESTLSPRSFAPPSFVYLSPLHLPPLSLRAIHGHPVSLDRRVPRTGLGAAAAVSRDRLEHDDTAHDAPRDCQPTTRRPGSVSHLRRRPCALHPPTPDCSPPLEITGAHVSPFANHHPHATMVFLAAYATFVASPPTATMSLEASPRGTANHDEDHHSHAQRRRWTSLVAGAAFIRPSMSALAALPLSPLDARAWAHPRHLHRHTPGPMPRLLASPDYHQCRSAPTCRLPSLRAPVGRRAAPPPSASHDVAIARRRFSLNACLPTVDLLSPSDPVAQRPHLSSGSLARTSTCVRSARGARSSFPCRRDLCIVVLWIPPLPLPLAPQPSSVQLAAPSASRIVFPSRTRRFHRLPPLFFQRRCHLGRLLGRSEYRCNPSPTYRRAPLTASSKPHTVLPTYPAPPAAIRDPSFSGSPRNTSILSLAHPLLEARIHFTSNAAHSSPARSLLQPSAPRRAGTDLRCASRADLGSISTLSLCVETAACFEARLCSARPWIWRAHRPRECVHAPDSTVRRT
ncbi:hypothetical protein B0H13DRAFT_2665628 [Mycena leptocephala]|nr:hypothetical protein B0H13DRAFT_2665628 [Mycena leptocephala]